MGAATSHRLSIPYRRETFSILSRIVGAATGLAGQRVNGHHRFQYPQSDRGRCNVAYVQDLPDWMAFQYPQSDRGRCNRSAGGCGSALGCLSVSSVGSWALQRGQSWQGAIYVNERFQYPQSDRGRCNLSAGVGWTRKSSFLSVSSVGSWALQLAYAAAAIILLSPFSILSRIVGAATIVNADDRASGALRFQYPQSDRGRCNFPCSTSLNLFDNAFQYPQSDRGRCNRLMGDNLPRATCLSVSSVGSWALQRLGR